MTSESLRLYLDEDINLQVANVLNKRGFDVLHVSQAKRKGASDHDQLSFAIRNQRCLMTHNVKDFAPLARELQTSGHEHFGIIFANQIPFSLLLEKTVQLLQTETRQSMIGKVTWLPH